MPNITTNMKRLQDQKAFFHRWNIQPPTAILRVIKMQRPAATVRVIRNGEDLP
jgi:hypothetical protein